MEHLIKTYQDFLDENGEKKWQDFWEKEKLFEAKDGKGEKYYCLIEFPYPSAEGLHVGHPRSYTALDIVARKRRMQGHNVLYPIGWDAFGLPAENYAIKTGTHPRIKTEENINNFRRQLKSLGFSFDWSREVNTTDPEYYKWTQWIFLKLFERGLAYKAEVAINFCTSCKVGLANEEVVGGKCERCGGEVVKKVKSQWMLKITEYADRLEKDLDKVDYIERVKTQQRNWIGRSEGAIVQFKISGSNSSPLTRGRLGGGEGDGNNTPPQPSPYKGEGENIVVYTTRPDTLFGATYMVLAPEHELVQQLKDQIENFDEVEKYITDAAKKSDLERTELNKEKTGVELKGIKAINPVNNKEIPVWISDYVLAGYGTGAIMAVPAHDERDFEFAKKFNLPMITVITPNKKNVIGIGAMIQTKDEKFLFQRRDHQTDRNPGMLAFFGGGIEGQEDIEQTLKREVKEELNLEINNFVLLNKLESHNKPGSFLDIFYVRDIKEERIKLGEGAGIEKLDLLEALERDDVTPFTKKAIKYLLENKCFTEIDQGQMINSDFLNGLLPAEAIKKMTAWLEEKGVGKKAVNYKLRDWVFSRQRYWGEPIPVAYCENCASKIKEIFRDNSSPFIRGRLGGGNGDDNTPPQPPPYKGEGEYSIGEILNPGFVPLSEKDLPLVLPEVTEFQAGEDGESPLAKLTDWVNVKCPKCGGEAKRETDTMPQWAGSSWYFLRYCDPRNKKALASEKNLKYWTPVDWYNGGMEHTTLHLLYSRFWHKFLFDIGVVPTDEPYQKRTSHGMVLGEGGEKMSKSRGNVINPDDVVKQYGADTLRVYEMFMGPFDSAIPWDTKGVVGVRRFLDKVWNLFVEHGTPNMEKEDNGNMEILLNQTIKKVSDDIEGMGFNTAVSALMILTNKLMEQKVADQKILEKLLILLSPFAPHLAEELWEKSGHKKSIIIEKWPVADESKLRSETVEFAVQVNGKLRAKISLPPDVSEAEAVAAAKELDNVKKYLSGQEIKKTIFVPGRMISFVV